MEAVPPPMASTSAVRVAQALVEPIPEHLVPGVLPFRVYRASATLCGQPTQVICHEYADRTLVLVSQIDRVGCLTEVTIQRRPQGMLALASSAAAWNPDEEETYAAPGPSLDADPTAAGRASEQERALNSTASLLTDAHQQRLFGQPPRGQSTLYDLYNVHVAQTAQKALRGSNMEDEGTGLARRPVVVGLALSLHTKEGNARGTGSMDQQDDEDDEDFDLLTEDERQRFTGIMDLVYRACTGTAG